MNTRICPMVMSLLVLAGCAAAPRSYIQQAEVYHPAIINRYPVVVLAVDGSSFSANPLPVAPGEHVLRISAPPVAGFRDPVVKDVPLKVEPCTRYYLAAQRPTRLTQDWQLVIDHVESVGACEANDEMRKAATSRIDTGTAHG